MDAALAKGSVEVACQYVSVGFATLLSYWSRLSRLALLRRRYSNATRFVPFAQRCWSSDLPWSMHFWRTVQDSKWNRPQGEQPPINWKGVLNMKDPFSLASYPLLIQELRPATIIELGAYSGGSAFWLADMFEIHGIDGRIYSFDINMERIAAKHPRVEFKWADSKNLQSFDAEWLASLPHPWLVIEDAHQNLYNVLSFFGAMMRPGDYLVVEDTLYYPKYRTLKRFILDHHDQYLVDTRYVDLFGYNVTWHPNSYFKKV